MSQGLWRNALGHFDWNRILMRCTFTFGACTLFFVACAAQAAELKSGESKPALGSGVSSSGAGEVGIVDFINAEIRKGWADSGYTASPKATDGEWCRRAFLDIIGRVPTVGELNLFMSEPANVKKQKLLDRLLDSDEYAEEYANYWATVWSNLLIGRPPQRRVNGELVNRDGMHQYLRVAFLRNKPYDQMVYELVSATGNTSPDEQSYNGATNFIASMMKRDDPMLTQATSKTAKIFLGLQVQCTQCRNHPFNDWKQEQFWSMNAFFRQTHVREVSRQGRDVESAALENSDFRGEGSTPNEAEIYYELRNGTMAVAYPTFVDGTKINPSGYVSEIDRRSELGKLMIKSEYLGKAISNRLWGHFLGYGFTKPVDDLGPHNVPSHPELLDRMGKEFAGQGHDYKKLIRWIVMTEAYSLSSRVMPKNKKDDPSLGEKPKFSRFYLRQMQPEQLYDSLQVAKFLPSEDRREKGTLDDRLRARREWMGQFTVNLGNDEGEDLTTFNGTIPQILMMMNGPLIKEVTGTEGGSLLSKLAASGMKPQEVIDYMYLAAFARKPGPQDLAMCQAALAAHGAGAGYQDIWWALLNSNEFIFVH
ncbi:MAG TPA: DUF1549 domain-containing protein [Pirellulales bacterium]|nr:DUF1549 domain-containing protein [Pirellulales bacterium]